MLKYEFDRRQGLVNIGYGYGSSPYFAKVLFGDGTAAAPSISFINDTDTGFYRGGSGLVVYSSNGTASLSFNAAGQIGGATANYLNLPTGGAVSLVAGGTNQNITLTPSGTGSTRAVGSGAALSTYAVLNATYAFAKTDTTLRNVFSLTSNDAEGSTWKLLFSSTGNATAANRIFDIQTSNEGVANNGILALQSLGGAVAIGTTVNSGALLQVGTNTTTSAGGMVFGTDTPFYRLGVGQMCLGTGASNAYFSIDATVASQAQIVFRHAGSEVGRLGFSSSTSMTLTVAGATALTLDSSQNATFAGYVVIPAAQPFVWSSSTKLTAPSNGVLKLSNNGETDFSRLQFGGTTSSFPSIKRSGATLAFWLADDSGYCATQDLYNRVGSGTPEGAVSAPVGAVFHRTDGGASTSLYVKESGSGNTGWVAK